MKKKIAFRWIAALRSGLYKQGQGKLRNKKNEFCCLGVLCNLHAQDHPKIAAKQKKKSKYCGADIYLPSKVQDWAGLRTSDGNPEGFPNYSLTTLNDTLKYDFELIANYIKDNWKRL
jgi:hypothetical protein